MHRPHDPGTPPGGRVGRGRQSTGIRAAGPWTLLALVLLACGSRPPPPAPLALPGGESRPFRGMYRYLADAAVFTDCDTGETVPVVIDAGHEPLERTYLKARRRPGDELFVTLDGHLESRAPEPGLPSRPHLVVDRFGALWPGERCPVRLPPVSPLFQGVWEVREIGGEAVEPGVGAGVPTVEFDRKTYTASGSTGCNRWQGAFEASSGFLRILSLSTTRRGCSPRADRLEAAFLQALGDTSGHRLDGHRLELRDVTGEVRMRLEGRMRGASPPP